MKKISVSDFRQDISQILDDLRFSNEEIIITRAGKPIAIVATFTVDEEELES